MNFYRPFINILSLSCISSLALAQTPAPVPPVIVPPVVVPPKEVVPPKAIPVEEPSTEATPDKEAEEKLTPAPPVPEIFTPSGSISGLTDQADIDLFTRGKDIGNVQDNPKLYLRRLVQRTMMPTENRPSYGAILTFDDQLIADSPSQGNALDIVNELAPLGGRSIFFANVPRVSAKTVNGIIARNKTSEKRLAATKELLESKREEFITIIRSLIKIKCPSDADGNVEYAAEVYNHTAFHQNMGTLKTGTDRFNICIMGIEFIEECLEEAYLAERPDWKRATYFRFPFLAEPRGQAARDAVNATFTKLGLVCLGETQDSKDYDNYSHKVAYTSLLAAKKGRRYNPKYGTYGRTEKPIALFHTKTWPKIKRGIIKAVTEK